MRIALLLVAVIACAPAPAQDVEFVRALERAQAARPARLGAVARIAPETEPGTPLVINGRVFQSDGRTPAAGITVFAYHTDANGHYDVPSAGPHSWRLKGWAITGADGRFEFRTIRPASYPNATIPQHVHLFVEGPSLPRRGVSDIEFDDDPKVTASQREASKRAGIFGGIRPVSKRNGVDHVEINLRIEERGRF
jgi:protocatechuate 3,4-dioxygenase beta subunit